LGIDASVKYSWLRRWDLVCAAALGLFMMGCATGSTTAGSALVHSHFPYAVTYDDERAKSVMGDDWTLETYRVASQSSDGAVLERKEGYTTEYDFDFDDDDKGDRKEELPYPDLRFLNKKTDAHLEVTTVLLDKRLAKKKLKVLLGNIVESSTGSRSLFVAAGEKEAASVGADGKRVMTGVEKRYATRIVDQAEATLGSEKGLVATLESSDLDQVEVDSKAVATRSRMFLVRAPFDYLVANGSSVLTSEPVPAKPELHRYSVLLVVEYRNTPEDYEAGYADFLRLMGKIHLLTDDMMLELLAEPLSKCSMASDKKARLKLKISETGTASVDERSGFEEMCVGFVESYRFTSTGESRSLEREYDFNKPLKPGWLSQSTYVEQRAPVEVAPPEAPAAPPESDAAAPNDISAKPEAQPSSAAPETE
jgi:hypothetical protein